jgi:hypothetical protein
MSKSEIVDVTNEVEDLKEIDNYFNALIEGLRAVEYDFGYHRKAVFPSDKMALYRHSIQYRLFSARFHIRLLYRHISEIQIKHQRFVDQRSFFPVYETHLERNKREASALFDSIVFHLYSSFDYLGSIIFYVLTKHENTKDWDKIKRSAEQSTRNKLFLKPMGNLVAQEILKSNKDFVNSLNLYRNMVIHRESDVSRYEHEWNLGSNETKVYFFCTKTQTKRFGKFCEPDKKYTLPVLAKRLVLETITITANILTTLKVFMEVNSSKDEIPIDPERGMVYSDSNGNPVQMSLPHWKEFDTVFKKDIS